MEEWMYGDDEKLMVETLATQHADVDVAEGMWIDVGLEEHPE